MSSAGPSGLTLQGNSPSTINTVAIVLIVGVCLFPIVVCGAKLLWTKVRKPDAEATLAAASQSDRPALWVWSLLVASYALLIPGLVNTIFSLNIGALNTMSLREATETMLSFVATLSETGGYVGASCVVIFAIVIPVFKIFLLFIGELWRHSPNPSRVGHARRCIIALQLASKWACPDMFAYICMLFLVRGLNHPPTMQGLMHLDIGFSCFSIFCLGSTISSLGIRLPVVPLQEQAQAKERRSLVQYVVSRMGTRGVTALAACLTVACATLLILGITTPIMAMRLNLDVLYENGTIPEAVRPFVESLNLPELARADVNVWNCILALAGWIRNGEVNAFLAFVMIAVNVLVLTVLDLLALNVVAIGLHGSDVAGVSQAIPEPSSTLAATRILKKLSMLDVMVVGVVVVVLSGEIYKEQGLVLTVRWGLALLAGAEACHYALHCLVTTAAEFAARVPKTSVDEKVTTDSSNAGTDNTVHCI